MAMSGHAQWIADLLARHDLPAIDAGKSGASFPDTSGLQVPR